MIVPIVNSDKNSVEVKTAQLDVFIRVCDLLCSFYVTLLNSITDNFETRSTGIYNEFTSVHDDLGKLIGELEAWAKDKRGDRSKQLAEVQRTLLQLNSQFQDLNWNYNNIAEPAATSVTFVKAFGFFRGVYTAVVTVSKVIVYKKLSEVLTTCQIAGLIRANRNKDLETAIQLQAQIDCKSSNLCE